MIAWKKPCTRCHFEYNFSGVIELVQGRLVAVSLVSQNNFLWHMFSNFLAELLLSYFHAAQPIRQTLRKGLVVLGCIFYIQYVNNNIKNIWFKQYFSGWILFHHIGLHINEKMWTRLKINVRLILLTVSMFLGIQAIARALRGFCIWDFIYTSPKITLFHHLSSTSSRVRLDNKWNMSAIPWLEVSVPHF